MTEKGKGARGTRPRGLRIDVWVTPEERSEIASRSDEAGLSLSAYLRASGLNHRIHSVYDLNAVMDLVRVNGDLGRVAGLLKLWLADQRNVGERAVKVEEVMLGFRALQKELTDIISKARR